jgi:hypothetical protein
MVVVETARCDRIACNSADRLGVHNGSSSLLVIVNSFDYAGVSDHHAGDT